MTKKSEISFCQGHYLGSSKFFSTKMNKEFRKCLVRLNDDVDITEAYADIDAVMPSLNSEVTLRKYNDSYTMFV